MEDRTLVGVCTSSHYYEDMKAIRFTLKFDGDNEVGFEWPITMFKFDPKMDKTEEMRKTSKLMIGKKIGVKIEQ